MSNVYEISEPLIVAFKWPGGETVDIDVIMAAEVLGEIQTRMGFKTLTESAEHYRPWVAQKIGVDVEDITLGQVVEFSQMIVDASNRNHEECKKKQETTLCSLFSTLASRPDTPDGRKEQKTPGSQTSSDVKPGETEPEA